MYNMSRKERKLSTWKWSTILGKVAREALFGEMTFVSMKSMRAETLLSHAWYSGWSRVLNKYLIAE